jgi:phosphoribosylformylglycinamidine synthase subunit PurS
MKIGVRIMPRNEVLDTQGRAVEKTLQSHNFQLNSCRVGRFVELDLPVTNKEMAMKEAKEIAEFVLHNPLIENYELEWIDGK